MRAPSAVACGIAVLLLTACSPAGRFEPRTPSAAFSATACPRALGRIQDVRAPVQPDGRLVDVRGGIASALICDYRGLLDPGRGWRRTLSARVRLRGSAAERLAASAAAVPVGAPLPGGIACPADYVRVTVITFAAHDGRTTSLWWHSTGCQTIDNGSVEAQQVENDAFGDFQTAFARLTAASRGGR